MSFIPPDILADAILVFHALIVAFIVLSVPLILLGGWRGWGWVRRPGFRYSHLAAIAFVVANTWLGELCPLTIWENELRLAAGQQGIGDSFIGYWLGKVIFYDLPGWFFTVLYTAFGLLVAALFRLVPLKR